MAAVGRDEQEGGPAAGTCATAAQATPPSGGPDALPVPYMSKKAQKREAKRAQWKERKRLKREAAGGAGEPDGQGPDGVKPPNKRTLGKIQKRKVAREWLCSGSASDRCHVAFDLSFCGTMKDGELNSMVRT